MSLKPVRKIFVGQWVEDNNNNAQMLNARSLLANFTDEGILWIAPYHDKPDRRLLGKSNVRLVRLHRRRIFDLHNIAALQASADAVFYPPLHWSSVLLLPIIRKLQPGKPVIRVLEGLASGPDFFTDHPDLKVHEKIFHPTSARLFRRNHRVQNAATSIIAISEFLGEIGTSMYGDKIDVLPLGVEEDFYVAGSGRSFNSRPKVMCVGTVYERKRPHVFIDVAARTPQADFVWYGEGPLRQEMLAEIQDLSLSNVDFPGPILNRNLPAAYADADLFVLPSLAEGVPKVSQEAAAAGLPLVLYGDYRPTSVVDGENGFLAWSDADFCNKVTLLVNDSHRRRAMGRRSAELAQEWRWSQVARRWEEKIISLLDGSPRPASHLPHRHDHAFH